MTPVAAYLLLFLAVGIGFIFVHLMAGKFIRPNKPDPSKGTIYECGEPTIGSAWIQFDLRFYVVALLFVIFDVEVAFFFPWAVVFGKANAVADVGKLTDAERFHQTAERVMELIPPHQLRDATPQNVNRLRELKEKKEAALRGQREETGKVPENKLSAKEEAEWNSLNEKLALQIKRQRLMDVSPQDVDRLRELEEKKRTVANHKLSTEEEKELGPLVETKSLAVQTQQQARSLAWLALLEIAVFFGVLLVGFAYLWRRGDLAWVRSLAAERPSSESAPPPAPVVRQSAPLTRTAAHA